MPRISELVNELNTLGTGEDVLMRSSIGPAVGILDDFVARMEHKQRMKKQREEVQRREQMEAREWMET